MNEQTGALIFLYHRVNESERDPQLLAVSPENFRAHVEVLKQGTRLMPLAELVDSIEQGRVPERAAAITFDDGYADNLEHAAPILRAFDAPATVFATTGHTNCDAEFYWDDLDRIFLGAASLPRYLRLWLADSAVEIDLGDFDYYAPTVRRAHREWTILDTSDPTPRHHAYRQVCRALHQAPLAIRRDALNQLQAWSGIPCRKSHRQLTVEEMRELSRDGLVAVGGHTVDHPVLALESEDAQRQQVSGNRETLEWIIGHAPAGFSYPYGTRHDFTAATIDIVKKSGYAYACANTPGQVNAGSNPFQLPRHVVRNWGAEEFEANLNKWFTPARAMTKPERIAPRPIDRRAAAM